MKEMSEVDTGTIREDEASHLGLDVTDFQVFQVHQASPVDLVVQVFDFCIDRIVSRFLRASLIGVVDWQH